jgi:hypothetical protein
VPIDSDAFEKAMRNYDEARNEVLKFAAPGPRSTEEPGCSFCCRPKSAVRASVAGPNVLICNECVLLCHKVLTEQGTLE